MVDIETTCHFAGFAVPEWTPESSAPTRDGALTLGKPDGSSEKVTDAQDLRLLSIYACGKALNLKELQVFRHSSRAEPGWPMI